MFFVYILYNAEIDRYYVGQTHDIVGRLNDHNNKGHKVKYTKKQIGIWNLVYAETFYTRGLAMKREKELNQRKASLILKI